MTAAVIAPIGAAVFSGSDELSLRVGRMRKGERITYHRGFLANDRMMAHDADGESPRVGKVATAALKLFEAGLIYLTQKKVRDGLYEYYATRR